MHVTSLENVPLVQTSLDTFIHEVFSRLEHDLCRRATTTE